MLMLLITTTFISRATDCQLSSENVYTSRHSYEAGANNCLGARRETEGHASCLRSFKVISRHGRYAFTPGVVVIKQWLRCPEVQ